MYIFISHSSSDHDTARGLCELLESNGHACFLALRDIRSGYEYAEEIINGIDNSDAMLLLLSEKADSSPHVLREIERAVSRKIPILVYQLEKVQLSKSMEYFLMTHQWISTGGDGDYSNVLRSVNELGGKGAAELPDSKSAELPDSKSAELPGKAQEGRKARYPFMLLIPVAVAVVGIVIGFACRGLFSGKEQTSSAVEQTSSAAEQTSSTTEQTSSAAEQTSSAVEQTLSAAEQTSSATEQTSSTAEQTSSTAEQTSVGATAEAVLPEETAEQTAATPPYEETAEAVPVDKPAALSVELGSTIVFGSYNNEPIRWRVIAVSQDGSCATVISDDILTMKAYDAPEGGRFNSYNSESYWNKPINELDEQLQRNIRGSNSWADSNLRTWLNSDRENVQYSDQPPEAKAMSEGKNAYNTEAGFLNGFTKGELSAILPTVLETNSEVTEDRVFLLSSSEVSLLTDADVAIAAKPTAAAVELDRSNWYTLYSTELGVTSHFWWLRDHEEYDGYANACEVFVVGNGYNGNDLLNDSVGLEGIGVRPAMTIDLTCEYITLAD